MEAQEGEQSSSPALSRRLEIMFGQLLEAAPASVEGVAIAAAIHEEVGRTSGLEHADGAFVRTFGTLLAHYLSRCRNVNSAVHTPLLQAADMLFQEGVFRPFLPLHLIVTSVLTLLKKSKGLALHLEISLFCVSFLHRVCASSDGSVAWLRAGKGAEVLAKVLAPCVKQQSWKYVISVLALLQLLLRRHLASKTSFVSSRGSMQLLACAFKEAVKPPKKKKKKKKAAKKSADGDGPTRSRGGSDRPRKKAELWARPALLTAVANIMGSLCLHRGGACATVRLGVIELALAAFLRCEAAHVSLAFALLKILRSVSRTADGCVRLLNVDSATLALMDERVSARFDRHRLMAKATLEIKAHLQSFQLARLVGGAGLAVAHPAFDIQTNQFRFTPPFLTGQAPVQNWAQLETAWKRFDSGMGAHFDHWTPRPARAARALQPAPRCLTTLSVQSSLPVEPLVERSLDTALETALEAVLAEGAEEEEEKTVKAKPQGGAPLFDVTLGGVLATMTAQGRRLCSAEGLQSEVVYCRRSLEENTTLQHGTGCPKWDTPALEFESRFESGNLHRAVRVGETEYDLMLQADVNTNGRTQWFFFRVTGMQADAEYTFNFLNLEKDGSVFLKGNRPVFWSRRRFETTGEGWTRLGEPWLRNVAYFPNWHAQPDRARLLDLRALLDGEEEEEEEEEEAKEAEEEEEEDNRADVTDPPPLKKCYYTLSFQVQFPSGNDEVFLSHFYPFTYSHLQRVLAALPQACVRRQTLCWTATGNECPLLTITDFDWIVPLGDTSGVSIEERPFVLLSARIHPGEVNSSWIMKGLLDFVTSQDPMAVFLRRNVVLKVVPMLNPDGVVNGNYRCSLAGTDLNRTWQKPHPEVHPTTHAMRRLMRQLVASRPVLLFVDMHGHSRIQNLVMYGCDPHQADAHPLPDTDPLFLPSRPPRLPKLPVAFERGHPRLLPYLFKKRAPNFFSFSKSKYSVQKSKQGAARVVFWREHLIPLCYTMEASFCSADAGPLKGRHFRVQEYEEAGAALGRAICDLLEPDQKRVQAAVAALDTFSRGSRKRSSKRRLKRRTRKQEELVIEWVLKE